MSDLYRLVYTSRNLLEGSEAERAEAVASILTASQTNNARVGITGALLFNGGSFAQVLEGARPVVERTFERIQRDTRHSDVNVLQCEPVEVRGFPNWSMAFVGQSAKGRALWHELADRTGFDLSRIEGEELFATLHAIVLAEEDLPVDAAVADDTSPQAFPGHDGPVTALDTERLRAELREASPANRQDPTQPSSWPAEGAWPAADTPEMTVLRASLDDERQRVTELRRALDDARVSLALAERHAEELRGQRDLWAGRTRALATLLAQDPGDALLPDKAGAGRAA